MINAPVVSVGVVVLQVWGLTRNRPRIRHEISTVKQDTFSITRIYENRNSRGTPCCTVQDPSRCLMQKDIDAVREMI